MRGICGMQYVVEADGSVYPCDFYVGRVPAGKFPADTVEMIDRKREEIQFIESSLQKEEACAECRYASLCRGGCRRTRQEEHGHHQYFCQSYKMFFDACLPSLVEIAERIGRG